MSVVECIQLMMMTNQYLLVDLILVLFHFTYL